ncbi:MAG: hypothetical protein RL434_1189, partial [Pseudomonadota bacterium]
MNLRGLLPPLLLAAALLQARPAQATDASPAEPSAPITPSGETSGSSADAGTSAASPPPGTGESLPLDDLRVFVEVFHKIKRDYVEDVSDQQLLENAIKGMLEGLDPHSAYLDGEAYTELQEGTSGEFGGLGIEIGTEDGLIKIISPIDDTPASRAGIQAGDTIIRLDGAPVRGMSVNAAVKKMRGEVGSAIELTIMREGEAKPLE